jgi:hypothetical protein
LSILIGLTSFDFLTSGCERLMYGGWTKYENPKLNLWIPSVVHYLSIAGPMTPDSHVIPISKGVSLLFTHPISKIM